MQIILNELKQFLLIFGVVCLAWIAASKSLNSKIPGDIDNPQPQVFAAASDGETVNYHLKSTYQKYEFDEVKSKVENENVSEITAEDYDASMDDRPKTWGLDLQQENHASKVDRELANFRKDIKLVHKPADRIEARLAHKDFLEEYDKAYEKQFVDDFKANALEEGFLVETDENHEVTKVRRLSP